MTEVIKSLKYITVGELKKLLSTVDDNVEIDFSDGGSTGWTKDITINITTFENEKVYICIDVEAESGFY